MHFGILLREPRILFLQTLLTHVIIAFEKELWHLGGGYYYY